MLHRGTRVVWDTRTGARAPHHQVALPLDDIEALWCAIGDLVISNSILENYNTDALLNRIGPLYNFGQFIIPLSRFWTEKL